MHKGKNSEAKMTTFPKGKVEFYRFHPSVPLTQTLQLQAISVPLCHKIWLYFTFSVNQPFAPTQILHQEAPNISYARESSPSWRCPFRIYRPGIRPTWVWEAMEDSKHHDSMFPRAAPIRSGSIKIVEWKSSRTFPTRKVHLSRCCLCDEPTQRGNQGDGARRQHDVCPDAECITVPITHNTYFGQ